MLQVYQQPFQQALADTGFTAELCFAEFNDYNYIIGGEIHIEPIPGV